MMTANQVDDDRRVISNDISAHTTDGKMEEDNDNRAAAEPILASASAQVGRIKVSRRRWIILALFVLYSGNDDGRSHYHIASLDVHSQYRHVQTFPTFFPASNAFQWTQLVIITNILEKYYNVSAIAVSWTSIIYMAVYIPLIFPASWFLEKKVTGNSSNLSK